MRVFLQRGLFAVLFLVSLSARAEETFDVLTFSAPKGWTKDAGADGEMIRYSKAEAGGNGFAMITVFRSVSAGPDSKANFDTAWAQLAQKPLDATTARMGEMKMENGWEVQTGSSPFQKDRLSGVVLLSTASAGNKMANLLLVTNSTVFQGEIESFIASIKLEPIAKDPVKVSPAGPMPAPASPSASGEKPEVWYAYYPLPGSFNYQFHFMAVYPNGDSLNSIPSEGILGVNPATRPQYMWGKRKVVGNEIHFDYGQSYGQPVVTRMGPVADGRMSYPPGSKTLYYRLKSVDGTRVDGEFASDSPDWYKKGLPADIVFHRDGTFVNRAVVTEIYDGAGKQLGSKNSGSGTYEIRDFTIVFKYSDGIVARRGFYVLAVEGGALPDAILMAGYPHYRRKD